MKKNLFDQGNQKTDSNTLKINTKFQKRYNHNRKREETDRLKDKYGKEEYDNFEESSNSSLSEDENGKLMNNDLLMDIMTIIPKIKNKCKDLYNKDKNFFKKNKKLENENLQKKEKKYTIKNMIVENLKNEQKEENDEEIEILQKETNYQKEKRLKNAFKQVAFETDEIIEDGFLKKKKFSPYVLESEKEISNFIEKGNEKMTEEEKTLVKNFWGEKNKIKMTEDERFLRDFIVKKKWMEKEEEKDEESEDLDFNKIDDEDEKDDEKIDNFEHKYNFRFEEEGGRDLQFYKRDIKNSLRRENTKRKDKREKLKQKKNANLQKIQRELKNLKNSKREKIINHIIKLKNTSQNNSKDYENHIKKILLSEFDENYDQIMEQMFNDDYYKKKDSDENDIKSYLQNIESEFSQKKPETQTLEKKLEIETQKKDGFLQKPNLPLEMRHNLKKEELATIEKSTNKLIWYFCDNCFCGIQPLTPRFDCLECPDFTICDNCFSLKEHEHKMKKFFVSENCFPPPDDEIVEIIGNMKTCDDCEKKINKFEGYYQHQKTETIICTSCINLIKGDLRLRDFSQIKPDRKKLKNSEIEGLLEEYEGLDFEDVIAGGLKTRYEYMQVEKDDFGLTDAELLFADDKILNQMISTKKLAPYKNNQITNIDRNRIRKMRAMVKKSAEKNQKKFRKEQDLLKREKELKILAKKSKKYKKEYERFLGEKEFLVEKIYRDYEDRREERGMGMGGMEREINGGLEDFVVEEEGVDQDRLKSYNL